MNEEEIKTWCEMTDEEAEKAAEKNKKVPHCKRSMCFACRGDVSY